MAKRKVHKESIRLYNNAGFSFPVCQRGAPLLDLDKTAWTTTGDNAQVTCAHCKRVVAKNRWA